MVQTSRRGRSENHDISTDKDELDFEPELASIKTNKKGTHMKKNN